MSIAEQAETDLVLPRTKMTGDEFLALPDDGIDRVLLDGELWEMGMTLRNRSHGRRAARIAAVLSSWNDAQPDPWGEITVGDTGFWLERDPASLVGLDVAYASPEVIARTPEDATYYEGPPVLAVEVLSPLNKVEDIVAKVRQYLRAGTVVWEVNPEYRTIQVHRPGLPVESDDVSRELVGDPYLPGFRVAMAEVFR